MSNRHEDNDRLLTLATEVIQDEIYTATRGVRPTPLKWPVLTSMLRYVTSQALQACAETAIEHAQEVTMNGMGPGSLSVCDFGVDYRVMTTSAIKDHAPGLYHLYRNAASALLRVMTGEKLYTLKNESAVNVNVLSSGLEWHVDGPDLAYTAIMSLRPMTAAKTLFHDPEFQRPDEFEFKHAGDIIFFPSYLPHAVENFVEDEPRVTVTMAWSRSPNSKGSWREEQERYQYGVEP